MTSVGVAMIARNSAGIMREALTPFWRQVDDIAIVLGGVSNDNTEGVARGFTNKISFYSGPLDEEGKLLDFGAARQQSFDMLATDWALVVDTDDLWSGAERLPALLEIAEEKQAQAVMVPYDVEGLFMYQLRLYRRSAGEWRMPVHEYFYLNGGEHSVIKTDYLTLKQRKRDREAGQARARHNAEIGLAWLERNGDDRHVLSHLGKDLVSMGDYDRALEMFSRYLAWYDKNGQGKFANELAGIFYHQAGTLLMLGAYDKALVSCLALLATQDYAPGWALLAEIFYTLGSKETPALFELAVYAADRALSHGKQRGGFASDSKMSLRGALQIKGEALREMGKPEEARAAFDLGLLIDPEHPDLLKLCQQMSQQLDELP